MSGAMTSDGPARAVTFEHRGRVALVTLSRPDRLNAVTPEMVEELHGFFDTLARSTRVRVVVVTGAGRAFCAGMDIRAAGFGAASNAADTDAADTDAADTDADTAAGTSAGPSADPHATSAAFADPMADPVAEPIGKVQAIYRAQSRASELVVRLREIPQPVIAALHGPAVGMGMSLALACDMRVADPTARFIAPFLRLGFSGGDLGLSWLLPRLVGASRAAEIIYRARTIDAATAAGYGLIAESCDAGRDVEVAMELAESLADASPFGLSHTKELLNLSLDAPGLRQQLAVEDRTQTMAFLTEDLMEGLAATMEKREPRFRNR